MGQSGAPTAGPARVSDWFLGWAGDRSRTPAGNGARAGIGSQERTVSDREDGVRPERTMSDPRGRCQMWFLDEDGERAVSDPDGSGRPGLTQTAPGRPRQRDTAEMARNPSRDGTGTLVS
jgi:hypothetical protein